MSFSKNLGPCKPAGTDLKKIWRPANLRGQIWEKYGATQTAGTDLEKNWRYANYCAPIQDSLQGSNGVRMANERRSKASESEFT